nr:MAK10-like protein [Tanacetum cinerariifolium]
MGEENPICTLGDYSRPSHKDYRNTIELLEGKNVVPLQSDTIQLGQNGCSFYGLRSEDPNQQLKDFLKLVDSLDLNGTRIASRCPEYIQPPSNRAQKSSSTLDGKHLASTKPTQMNKITTPCEICIGPHDTQYCMENPEQAFVEYASSRTDEAGGKKD